MSKRQIWLIGCLLGMTLLLLGLLLVGVYSSSVATPVTLWRDRSAWSGRWLTDMLLVALGAVLGAGVYMLARYSRSGLSR